MNHLHFRKFLALAALSSGVVHAQPPTPVSRPLDVTLAPASGSAVRGTLSFSESGAGLRLVGRITGLTPGAHGFHLHEKGDCSAPDASSAGGHFNPEGMKHGGLKTVERHGGDFGNITADATGTAVIDLVANGISLARDSSKSILGRAIVVHAQPDDEKSDPAGNSGGRIACGVVKN